MEANRVGVGELFPLIALTAEELESEIQARVGIRRSARLTLIVELMQRLLLEPAFNREDARTVLPAASLKTLDRAIADMESANLITLCRRNDRKSHGGAVYRMCPPSNWARRDIAIRRSRAARSARGGNTLSG